MNKYKESIVRQNGFTLIELMLVIALIGVITLMGASAYKQQSSNFKIDKGALQIQHWLQTAQAYYIDCQGTASATWPTADQILGNAPNCHLQNVTYAYDKDNPWGKPYSVSLTLNAGSLLFNVLSTVPDENTAKKLAARLPNATTSTAAPWIVTATVNNPVTNTTGGNEGQLIIMEIRSPVQSGTTIGKPSCPSGSPNPHIYLSSVAFIGTPFSGNVSPWSNLPSQIGPYKQQDWGGTATGGVIARYQDKGTGWLVTMTTYGRAVNNDSTLTQYWNYATAILTCEGKTQAAPPTPFASS